MNHTTLRHAGHLGSIAAIAVLLVGALAAPAMAEAVRAGDEDSGTTLTVEVTDGSTATPTPTISPAPAPGSSGPGSSGPGSSGAGSGSAPGSGSTSTSQATIPAPAAADAVLGDDAIISGGILAMSGITSVPSLSLGIGNGSVALDVVVRSTAATAFDATVRFRMDDVFGNAIGDTGDVLVDDLQPGETRRLSARIEAPGQHIVLREYVTVTPPETVDGVATPPLERTAVIFVPPLFSIAIAVGILVVGGLLWWVFDRRGLGLRWRPVPA